MTKHIREYLSIGSMICFFFLIGCSADSGVTPVVPDVEKPNAFNTGYSGTLTVYSGPTTITTPGAVVENVAITGMITIEADNVTFRNFKLDANGSFYGFSIASSCSGVLLESGEIYNMQSSGILGTGFTARRLNIHDSGGDGIKPQGLDGFPVLVEYCYIHHLGKADGAHADGCQTRGGRNITFRYNTIDMPGETTANYPGAPYKASGVFELQLEISNFVIEYNWLNGGGFTVRRDTYDGLPSGITVRGNKFGRDFDFGVATGTYEEWSGNTWEDTGEIVPAP